jgi:preprotein translocase subunit SecG
MSEINNGLHTQCEVRVSENFPTAITIIVAILYVSFLVIYANLFNYLKGKQKTLKPIRANRAKFVSMYENTRQILLKAKARICFNKTCKTKQLNLPHTKAITPHTLTRKN